METCSLGSFLCSVHTFWPDPVLSVITGALALVTYRMFRATASVAKETAELSRQTATLGADTVSGSDQANLHHLQSFAPIVSAFFDSADLVPVDENSTSVSVGFNITNIGPGPMVGCHIVARFNAMRQPVRMTHPGLAVGANGRPSGKFILNERYLGIRQIQTLTVSITTLDIFNRVWLIELTKLQDTDPISQRISDPSEGPFKLGHDAHG
jgi:hypothetical protein